MTEILQLQGTDARLYPLVGPLVMNPRVLKQNYNFPFRTTEKFVWYIAIDDDVVLGFVPVECKGHECVINNYYIEKKNQDVLKLLLEKIVSTTDKELELVSVTFLEDRLLFQEMGFSEEKVWTRYVKMKKNK